LGKKKSAASLISLRRQVAEANIAATKTIKDKSLSYRSPGYEKNLEIYGENYIFKSLEGISNDSKLVCQNLFTTTQTVPDSIFFYNKLFSETCRKAHDRNKTRIIKNILLLFAPSAETLIIYSATELKHLVFNINERWGESILIIKI
jgi:hypothetical protein